MVWPMPYHPQLVKKASQSFAPKGAKGSLSFFPAACTSEKIHLGPQTCEPAALAAAGECAAVGRKKLSKKRSDRFFDSLSEKSGASRSFRVYRAPGGETKAPAWAFLRIKSPPVGAN